MLHVYAAFAKERRMVSERTRTALAGRGALGPATAPTSPKRSAPPPISERPHAGGGSAVRKHARLRAALQSALTAPFTIHWMA
jgi:hypothetical protein